MKKMIAGLSPLGLLALAALVFFAAPPVPGIDQGIAASSSADSTTGVEISDPGSLPAAGGACLDADASALPGGDEVACCIDQCFRDRDCRAICGKQLGGQCVLVNSCCRECFCFGFAPPTGQPT